MSYLDGELPDVERRSFEEHLAECPDCVAYLTSYQQAVRLGKEVCGCGEVLPADVPEDLVQAILSAQARRA
jgi:anti-sigma factor RsiW